MNIQLQVWIGLASNQVFGCCCLLVVWLGSDYTHNPVAPVRMDYPLFLPSLIPNSTSQCLYCGVTPFVRLKVKWNVYFNQPESTQTQSWEDYGMTVMSVLGQN